MESKLLINLDFYNENVINECSIDNFNTFINNQYDYKKKINLYCKELNNVSKPKDVKFTSLVEFLYIVNDKKIPSAFNSPLPNIITYDRIIHYTNTYAATFQGKILPNFNKVQMYINNYSQPVFPERLFENVKIPVDEKLTLTYSKSKNTITIVKKEESAKQNKDAKIDRLTEFLKTAERNLLDGEAEYAKLAEEVKQAKLAEEAKQAKLAEEVKQAKLAEDAKQAKLAEDAKQAKLAEEAKQAKLAEEAKQAKLAEEAKQAKLAEDEEDEDAEREISKDEEDEEDEEEMEKRVQKILEDEKDDLVEYTKQEKLNEDVKETKFIDPVMPALCDADSEIKPDFIINPSIRELIIDHKDSVDKKMHNFSPSARIVVADSKETVISTVDKIKNIVNTDFDGYTRDICDCKISKAIKHSNDMLSNVNLQLETPVQPKKKFTDDEIVYHILMNKNLTDAQKVEMMKLSIKEG
jgi:hypothetical protein